MSTGISTARRSIGAVLLAITLASPAGPAVADGDGRDAMGAAARSVARVGELWLAGRAGSRAGSAHQPLAWALAEIGALVVLGLAAWVHGTRPAPATRRHRRRRRR